VRRVESQLKRGAGVLSAEALDEYQAALKLYQDIARTAR